MVNSFSYLFSFFAFLDFKVLYLGDIVKLT